jgi:hypothetical protein
MTALLRGLGQLSKEERPLVGKRANEIKEVLEAALAARQEAIAARRDAARAGRRRHRRDHAGTPPAGGQAAPDQPGDARDG